MSMRAAAIAALLSLGAALPAAAASIDLAAIGQRLGATILTASDVNVIFDGPNDFFQADDGPISFLVDGDPFDPLSATFPTTLTIFSPPFAGPSDYFGALVDFMLDASGAEGLFSDTGDLSGDLVLVRASFPAGLGALPGRGDFIDTFGSPSGVDVAIIDVAPIPLPAALPLTLAGIGALTLVGRRRRA